MDRLALVVVDPVRAFTDPHGVIGISETVERLASFSPDDAAWDPRLRPPLRGGGVIVCDSPASWRHG